MNSLLMYFSNHQKRCRYFVVTHRDKWQQHTYWMSSKNHVLAKPKNSSPTLERAFGLSFIFFYCATSFSRNFFYCFWTNAICICYNLWMFTLVTVSWEEEEEEDKKIYFTQLGLHMTQIEKITNKHININKEFKATR